MSIATGRAVSPITSQLHYRICPLPPQSAPPGTSFARHRASRRPCARPTWHPPQNVAQYGQADVEGSGRDTGALAPDQPALDHLRRDPVVSRVSPITLVQKLMWPDSVPSVLRVLRPRLYSRSRYSCAKWSNLGFCTIAGSWLSFRLIIIRRSSSAAEAMVFASRGTRRTRFLPSASGSESCA